MDCIAIDDTVQLYASEECRGGFDFPLLFEESILVLLPIALAVLLAAARCISLSRLPTVTASPWLGAAKTVCICSTSLSEVSQLTSVHSFAGRVLLSSISPSPDSGLHPNLPVPRLPSQQAL